MAQPTPATAGQPNGLRRFLQSPLFPIFMIVFVDQLGVSITIPVIPLYAENIFGASAREVAWLVSVYFLAQFIASPYLGRFSDRIGRRPVLIISQFGTFLALILSGAAPTLVFLYLARVIDGTTGGNITVAQAYLADITDEKNRARGLGLINAAFGSSFILGPAFGSVVAAYLGPRVPFYIAAGVSLITITLSIFKLPESLTPEQREFNRQQQIARGRPTLRQQAGEWKSLLSIQGMAIILLVAFLAQFSFFSFQSVWVLWADQVMLVGWDPKAVQILVGVILVVIGFFSIITQIWLIGPLVNHFGERRVVSGGVFIRGIAWSVMAIFPLLIPVAVVTPLLAVGGGVALPTLLALLTYIVLPEMRGQAIGMSQSVQNIGRILGPILAGELFERIAPNASMVGAAVLAGLTFIASLGLFRLNIDRSGRRVQEAKS